MKFRPAEIADIETLNSISVQSKAHWGYPSAWMEQWMDELTLDHAKFERQKILVVEDRGTIFGFCSLEEHADHYEIVHLWVLPKYIGKGFGKMLLKEALAYFVREDKPIIVESDPNAESFYKKQGFIVFNRVESYPKGRFLPVLKKYK